MAMYTCDFVRDLLIRLEGQISDRIYGKGATIGPWQAMTPRGTWPDGQGDVLNNIQWGRTTPSDDGDEWVDKTTSDFAGVDACNLDPEVVRFGQVERSMRIQRREIITEDICFEDLRSSFAFDRFMGRLQENLSFVSRYVWDSRARDEYIRLSKHHITEGSGSDINATSFNPASPPTSRLVWGTLEQIWDILEAEGAGRDGVSMGKGATTDRPVFDLFTDSTTMRDLIRQDPELREDFRFAYEGQGINAPLLMARGTPITYNGFRLVNDANVRRFDIVGGQKVWRPKYLPESSLNMTKGVSNEVNPFWLGAAYQASVVHIPAVYTQLMLPTKGPLPGMPFNAVSWMGDFMFKVIIDKVCNRHGNKGFFDALFASASEPGLTELGFVIYHKRCMPVRDYRPSCYS